MDLFLVETIFDTLNAKAALYALERLFEDRQLRLPVFVRPNPSCRLWALRPPSITVLSHRTMPRTVFSPKRCSAGRAHSWGPW